MPDQPATLPATLPDAFPAFTDTINQLQRTSPHFANLASQYDALSHAIHCHETGAPIDDPRPLGGLRLTRTIIRDQISAILRR